MTEYEMDAVALVKNATRTSERMLAILRLVPTALAPYADVLSFEEREALAALDAALAAEHSVKA
jgi:hypothetical protein